MKVLGIDISYSSFGVCMIDLSNNGVYHNAFVIKDKITKETKQKTFIQNYFFFSKKFTYYVSYNIIWNNCITT